MEHYTFTLTGTTPLIMHRDDVEAADMVTAARKDKASKDQPRGDDRFPAWSWQTYLYDDGELVCLPSDNIRAALCKAGASIPIPKGRNGKTFKAATQSGIILTRESNAFFTGGEEVAIADCRALWDEDFTDQANAVRDLGFRLLLKRAAVGQSKHVRVRPIFDEWSCEGEVVVTAPEITKSILQELFDVAGIGGIGDWRPSSSKKPGHHGQFSAKVKKA